jgi:hypothetical protein
MTDFMKSTIANFRANIADLSLIHSYKIFGPNSGEFELDLSEDCLEGRGWNMN